VKKRIDLIKSRHHPDDVGELISNLKIVVKYSAKKLHTSNEGQKAGWDICGDIAKPPGKYYQSLFHYPLTDSRSQYLTQIGNLHFLRVL